MDYAIYLWEAAEDLAVDVALRVALWRFGVHWGTVLDPVRNEVFLRLYQRRRARVICCDQILVWCHGMPQRDMAERIDESVLMQDVICSDQETESL